MKLWADFAPELAIQLPDCPTYVIGPFMKRAAIDYFRNYRIWRTDTPITVATTVLGQRLYTVTNPSGQELCGLPAIWINGKEVKEATPSDADSVLPDDTGDIKQVGVVNGTTIRVIPGPAADGVIITATVAYKPTEDALGLPDQFWAHTYRSTMQKMAMVELKRMKGKPWTDERGAAQLEKDLGQDALYDATMTGPIRRNRLRTKKQVI
jgi:hypothetical protein